MKKLIAESQIDQLFFLFRGATVPSSPRAPLSLMQILSGLRRALLPLLLLTLSASPLMGSQSVFSLIKRSYKCSATLGGMMAIPGAIGVGLAVPEAAPFFAFYVGSAGAVLGSGVTALDEADQSNNVLVATASAIGASIPIAVMLHFHMSIYDTLAAVAMVPLTSSLAAYPALKYSGNREGFSEPPEGEACSSNATARDLLSNYILVVPFMYLMAGLC